MKKRFFVGYEHYIELREILVFLINPARAHLSLDCNIETRWLGITFYGQ